MNTLTEAKAYVRMVLAMSDGDGDAVRRVIDRGERTARQFATATGGSYDAGEFDLQRQALADLTGNPEYLD